MENSSIKCRIWAIGIYLYSTNIKGISSMCPHQELGIGQKAVWFMLHRLHEAAGSENEIDFPGTVEVDEAYMGSKRRNMSNAKRKKLKDTRRGAVGKTAIVGIKDRETSEIRSWVVADTDRKPCTPYQGQCGYQCHGLYG
ncbi:MAG: transposase [Gammaproteobacteria bacterium]|nr:transposase [Gammaproteobacteria bacterium]